MNARSVTLVGGPLDGQEVPVACDQCYFGFVAGDREHTYIRHRGQIRMYHVRIAKLMKAEDELEYISSLLRDPE